MEYVGIPLAEAPRTLPRMPGLARASAGSFSTLAQWLTAAGGQAAGNVTEPMRQNVHVYRAVQICVQTACGLPRRLMAGDRELTGGPAYDLLNRPDRGSNLEDLMEESFLACWDSGETHIFDPTPGAIRPRRLVIAGRREMTPRYTGDGREVLYWEYRPRGATSTAIVPPEQHAYTRLPNPYDRFRGLSPEEAYALGLKGDWLSQQHIASSLANDGRPTGFMKLPGLTPEQREEYRRDLAARHGGPENQGKIGVIEEGEWIPVSRTHDELQLLELRKLSREEAYEAYGVPLILAGIVEHGTYDIADGAQEIFLWGPISYFARKIAALFTDLLLPRVQSGVRLEFLLDQHYVLQRVEQRKVDQYVKLFNAGVPPKMAAGWLRLPFADDLPQGDVGFVPASVTTIDEVVAGLSAPPEEQSPLAKAQSREAGIEPGPMVQAESLCAFAPLRGTEFAAALGAERRSEERQIRAQMPMIRQRFRAFWLRQERQLIARLRGVLAKPQSRERDGQDGTLGAFASLREILPRPWERAADDDAERVVKRILLSAVDEQGALRALARDYFPRAIEGTLRAELKRLGVNDEVIERTVTKVKGGNFIKRVLLAKQANIAGMEITTRTHIQRELVAGLRKGETIEQLAGRIKGELGDNRARALTVARNESGQAVRTARFAAASAAGATGKGWITGANPRPTHVQAGADYAPRSAPIPMDEPFEVGNSRLMYPGDPTGEAGEIINCNCYMVTVRLKAGEEGAGLTLVNASAA